MKKTTILILLSLLSFSLLAQKETITLNCLDSVLIDNHCSDCPTKSQYVCGIEIEIYGKKNKHLAYPYTLTESKYTWTLEGYNGVTHTHYKSHFRYSDVVDKIRECKGVGALGLIEEHILVDLDTSATNECNTNIDIKNNILNITDVCGTIDVDLSYLDSDEQQIEDFSVTGTNLTITLENGGTETVSLTNLVSLVAPNVDGNYTHTTIQSTSILGYQLSVNLDGTISLLNAQGTLVNTIQPVYTDVVSSDNSVGVNYNSSTNTYDLSVPKISVCDSLENCQVVNGLAVDTTGATDIYTVTFTDGTSYTLSDSYVQGGEETLTSDTFFVNATATEITFNNEYVDELGVTHLDSWVLDCDVLSDLNCLPPLAFRDEETTIVNTPVNVDIGSNDIGQDSPLNLASVMIVGASAEGGVFANNNDGTVTYTPPTDFVGVDSILYTINDLNNGETSNVAWIVVTVKGELFRESTVDDSDGRNVEMSPFGSRDCSDNLITNFNDYCVTYELYTADTKEILDKEDGSLLNRVVNFKNKLVVIEVCNGVLSFDYTDSYVTDVVDQTLINSYVSVVSASSASINLDKYLIDDVLAGVDVAGNPIGTNTNYLASLGFDNFVMNDCEKTGTYTEREGATLILLTSKIEGVGTCDGIVSENEQEDLYVRKFIKDFNFTTTSQASFETGADLPQRIRHYARTFSSYKAYRSCSIFQEINDGFTPDFLDNDLTYFATIAIDDTDYRITQNDVPNGKYIINAEYENNHSPTLMSRSWYEVIAKDGTDADLIPSSYLYNIRNTGRGIWMGGLGINSTYSVSKILDQGSINLVNPDIATVVEDVTGISRQRGAQNIAASNFYVRCMNIGYSVTVTRQHDAAGLDTVEPDTPASTQADNLILHQTNFRILRTY